ncbi:MAG: hypothetical protein HY394_02775 [Candidatus Diapherotrites archaeon]|nr:hypothetical protein [Candidatus Diapherotrites archaeon]
MARQKKYSIPLAEADVLDVSLEILGGEVEGFALNYRTKIGENFFAVYRVDTAHGYLHEQRFWLSPRPIPLPETGGTLKAAFEFYLDKIRGNFEKYKKHYLASTESG